MTDLWRRMIAASDEAIRDEPPGARADALIAQAHLKAVRDGLFPEGPPLWTRGLCLIWNRLDAQLRVVSAFIASCDNQPPEPATRPMLSPSDGEAMAPPVKPLDNQP